MQVNDLYLHPTVGVIDNSKMMTYKDCPRKFFFKHILGWSSRYPSIHLIFGSAYHAAQEFLALKGYDKKNLDEAMQVFLSIYREEFSEATDDDYVKNPERAEKALASYIKEFKDDPFETLYTEVGIPAPLGDDRVFHLKIDKILRRVTDGKIILMDFKTGSRELKYWAELQDSRNQFFGYIHGALCRYPFEQVEGLIVRQVLIYKSSPPKHKSYTVRKNASQMNAWLSNVRYWYDRMMDDLTRVKQESPDKRVMEAYPKNDNACASFGRLCPFYSHCWASPNPLKYYQTPEDCPSEFESSFWDPRTDPVSNQLNPETGEIKKIKKIKRKKKEEKKIEVGDGLLSSILGGSK